MNESISTCIAPHASATRQREAAMPERPSLKRRMFYMPRARKPGLGGTVHGMLAVQIGTTATPLFRIYRPATGRAVKVMRLEELQARCIHISKATVFPEAEAHVQALNM